MPKYIVSASQIYAHSVYTPIHRFNFYFVWCESKARIHEFLKAHDESGRSVEEPSKTSVASMHPLVIDNQHVPVICLPFKWEKTPDQISSVVHEVIHAVAFFFRVREIPLPKDRHFTEPDEENLCYYVDWLTRTIIEALDDPESYKYVFNDEIPYSEKPINKRRK